MKRKNCPNCGAPYDAAESKCPYCGTCYVDLSYIDLSGHEPFYLKVKLPYMNGDIYLTQKVIPDLSGCSFEQTVDSVDVYDGVGHILTKLNTSVSFNTNLAFQAVSDNNTVFYLKKE